MEKIILKKKGYYQSSAEVVFTPSDLPDYSKIAIAFSGQGNAYQDMFKEIKDEKIFKLNLQLLENFLKRHKLPSVDDYLKGNDKKIKKDLSKVKLLLLHTFQVSTVEILKDRKIFPAILTGHSFGEFAVMVGVGILNLQDMLEVVLCRENILEQGKEIGEMIAVKINATELHEVLKSEEHGYWISNYNSPEQIVVSLKVERSIEIKKKLKNNKIAFIEMDLPWPYHTPWMSEHAVKFRIKIEDLKLKLNFPLIPFYSSILKCFVDSQSFKDDVFYEIIEKHLVESVNFEEQVNQIVKIGIYNFIEIGPSIVLKDFIKKSAKADPENLSISYYREKLSEVNGQEVKKESREILLDVKSSKFFSSLNSVMSLVTGYELSKIKIQDKIQEDLGIDSIKKAEIIFKVLDETGSRALAKEQSLNLSDLVTMEDLINYFARQEKVKDEIKSGVSQQVVANKEDYKFSNRKLIWKPYNFTKFEKTSFNLEFYEHEIVINDFNELNTINGVIDFLKKNFNTQKLIHVKFSNLPSNEMILNGGELFYVWIKNFVNYFKTLTIQSPWSEQNIAVHFYFSEKFECSYDLCRSFLKSWARENGNLNTKIIIANDNLLCSSDFFSQITYEFYDRKNCYVKYDKNSRYVLEFDETNFNSLKDKNILKNILVIGGHRGIGYEIVTFLSKKYPSIHFLILGRSEKTSEMLNGNFNLHYEKCDVRDLDNLKAIINDFVNQYGDIELIINSAGNAANKFLNEFSNNDFEIEISTKTVGFKNLIQTLEDFSINELISFSSTTGHYGNPGQAGYVFSNSYLDVVAKRSNKNIRTICWPSWDNVGLTQIKEIKSFIDMAGLTYLKKDAGIELFNNFLQSDDKHAYILDNNSILRYQQGAFDRKSMRQFLSFPQSPIVSSKLELAGVNLKSLPYLKEHLLSGQPVLAASNMMALFLTLGYMHNNAFPDLFNFIGLNFIFISNDSSMLQLDLIRDKMFPSYISFALRSSSLHAAADISFKNSKLKRQKIEFEKYEYVLEDETIDNPIIQTMGSFRLTQNFKYNPATLDVEVEFLLKDFIRCTEEIIFDFLFQMIETCYQSLGVMAYCRNSAISVPKSVAELRLNQNVEITNKLFAKSFIKEMDELLITADSYVYNERGEVVLEVIDLKFATIQKVTPFIKYKKINA